MAMSSAIVYPWEPIALKSVSYNLLGLVATLVLSRMQYSYVYIRISRSKLWILWPHGYFGDFFYFLETRFTNYMNILLL